jgi:glucosyl-3-phosphoglycerate phosphatase
VQPSDEAPSPLWPAPDPPPPGEPLRVRAGRSRLYVMRHGHSLFQETYEVTGVDPGIEDAGLSERGRAQVQAVAERVARLELDLVVTSPFTRALDTALGVVGESDTPIHVDALVRERLGDACDIGRPASELALAYPKLEFRQLEDVWWSTDGEPDERGVPIEPRAALDARVAAFEDWLATREEQSILLVSHAGFIRGLAGIEPDNCALYDLDPRWAPGGS